ncbi:hypothetical protein GCM10008018_66270 [Paenibacillus marchantiophytorum]|uniref:DUF1048 domain-containing protein n=1 Tax=Paenibacillus marchantiophytorum TaxID=1619310 RepID=A0ABQ1FIF0_9BACL|nr:hypothetical protein GCM10008018_66270 [Paenibacillus marchantiophytorum]
MDSRKNRLNKAKSKNKMIVRLYKKLEPFIGLVRLLPSSWFHNFFSVASDVCIDSYDFLIDFISSCLLYQPDRGYYVEHSIMQIEKSKKQKNVIAIFTHRIIQA